MSKKSGKAQVKLALSGARGRMGQEIRSLIGDVGGVVLSREVNSGADWKALKPTEVDMVVDFSSPEGMRQAIRWCLVAKKPLVSGTTGISTADRTQLRKAGLKIPVLHSANMSLGIAVMGAMFEAFSAIEDWDFQIEEAHHSQKKDRPSGTAILLQDQLSRIVRKPLPEPNAIRGGGTPGIHQVWAMGPEEAIVIQHTAFQRKVFARGALRAARWLFDKKQPGLYDLSDLYKK